jgi:hypothetical protein
VKTIEKYKFQFKPLNIKDDEAEVVITIEVSGTFDGSPVTLDYHFTIENEKSYPSQLISELMGLIRLPRLISQ